MGVATRSVEKQNDVISAAGRIAVKLPKRKIVKLQLGERLAGSEPKVLDRVIAVLDRPLYVGFGLLRTGCESCQNSAKNDATDHERPVSCFKRAMPERMSAARCS